MKTREVGELGKYVFDGGVSVDRDSARNVFLERRGVFVVECCESDSKQPGDAYGRSEAIG